MKKTRKYDLEELEQGVYEAKTDEGRIHRKAILEAVYEQMKDDYLEKLRIQLIDALKRNDIIKINQIRKLVQDYVKSRSFITSQYKAQKRISQKEAEIWARREVRKDG